MIGAESIVELNSVVTEEEAIETNSVAIGPANDDRSNWKVVLWKPPAPTKEAKPRLNVHQPQFFLHQLYQRPAIIAYNRIVHSPTQGPKQQTFYFGVQAQRRYQHQRVNAFFQPPRRS